MLDNTQTTDAFTSTRHYIKGLIGASQIELEELYSKYQLLPCIRQEFVDANFPEHMEAQGIPVEFGLSLMVQMVLHKRAHLTTLVGVLMVHFEDEEKPGQACADMLLKAAEADLVDVVPETGTFVLCYDICADTQRKLDVLQFPLPMIEEPMVVSNNRQTGYRTIRGSLILRNNHHDDDICLDHINRVNAIPLSLNADTVAFVQNRWKNHDKKKDGETQDDFQKRKRAFTKYDRSSRDVLTAMMAQGNRFWLTHRYDKRGRTYCQGYHVTYQGNDWNKACIQLADAEPLNKE